MLRTLAPVLTWHLRSADRSRRYSNPRARYLMMFLRFRTTFLCYCYCFYCCCCCCFCSCTMPCMQQGDALVALEKSGHSHVAAGLTFCFLSFFLSLRWPFAAAAAHRPLSMSIEWNSKIFAFVILFLFSFIFLLAGFVYLNMVNRCCGVFIAIYACSNWWFFHTFRSLTSHSDCFGLGDYFDFFCAKWKTN